MSMRAKPAFRGLVDVVALTNHISLVEAEKVLKTVLRVVATYAARGSVRLPKFGTFSVRTRKGRTVRNPRTKELMQLPATKVLHFRPAKAQRGLR